MKSESEFAQSCLTLCDPMDCSLPGSSIRGIFQARVLEWGAVSSSRESSWPRNRTRVSHIVGRRFTVWAPRGVHPSFRVTQQFQSWANIQTKLECEKLYVPLCSHQPIDNRQDMETTSMSIDGWMDKDMVNVSMCVCVYTPTQWNITRP